MYKTTKFFIVLLAFTSLVIMPLNGFCNCQKLGEYCGNPASETFPACCPFDTDTNGEQVPLTCDNVDNGVGTCEVAEAE